MSETRRQDGEATEQQGCKAAEQQDGKAEGLQGLQGMGVAAGAGYLCGRNQ